MKNYKLKNFNAKNYNFKKTNFMSNLDDKNKKSNNFKLQLKTNGIKIISSTKHSKNNSKYSNTPTINLFKKINELISPLKFILILKITNNNKKYNNRSRKVSQKDIFISTMLIIYKRKLLTKVKSPTWTLNNNRDLQEL